MKPRRFVAFLAMGHATRARSVRALTAITVLATIIFGCSAGKPSLSLELERYEACAGKAGRGEPMRDGGQYFILTSEATGTTRAQVEQEARMSAIAAFVEATGVYVTVSGQVETGAVQRKSGGLSAEEVRKITQRIIKTYSGAFVTDVTETARCPAIQLITGEYKAISQIQVPRLVRDRVRMEIQEWPSKIYPIKVLELVGVFNAAQQNLAAAEIVPALHNLNRAAVLAEEANALEFLIDPQKIRERPTTSEIEDQESRTVNGIQDLKIRSYRRRVVAGRSSDTEVLASFGEKNSPIAGLPVVFEIEAVPLAKRTTGPSGTVKTTESIERLGTMRIHARPDIGNLQGEVSPKVLATLATKDTFTPPIAVEPKGSHWPWAATMVGAAVIGAYGWQQAQAVDDSNNKQKKLLAEIDSGKSFTAAQYRSLSGQIDSAAADAKAHKQNSELAYGTAAVMVGVALWLYPHEQPEEPPIVLIPMSSLDGRAVGMALLAKW